MVTIVGGSIGLYVSPLLRVQERPGRRRDRRQHDEVLSRARIDDESMLTVDLAAAERRVEAIPMVQEARLERRWPQTIRIVITERAPWALWKIGDAHYVIDNEGVVLPGSAPIENAPVIQDITGQARLVPGDRVDRDAVVLAKALPSASAETLALNVSVARIHTPAGWH